MPRLPIRFASIAVKYRLILAGTLVMVLLLPQWTIASDRPGAGDGRIVVAQKEDPKKKGKPQPKVVPKQQVQPQPKVIPKQQVQPQPKVIPKQQVQPQPKVIPKQQVQPQPKVIPKQQVQPQPKVIPKQQVQPQPKVIPKQQVQPQPKFQPKQQVQPKAPVVLPKQQFVLPKGGLPKGNVQQISKQRKVRVEGGRRVIVEPGNRFIIRDGRRAIIRHDDSARLRRFGNARFEVRGRNRYTIIDRGPYQIVTVTDANGRLIRRYRRYPNGREVVFLDNRRSFRPGAAAAVGAGALLLGLAAPAITIPRNRYVVDAAEASPALLYETLAAPPLVASERPYSLDEIRENVELRDRMRSIDLSAINFSSGSWEVTPDQYPRLQAIAEAILKLLQDNPDAVVMIEGHTDAVGPDEDNLSLSDRRAEAVAEILTGQFQIPPENLVTQGYGEQHLRVQTEGPSRENRRVVVRNIAPLLGEAQQEQDGPDQGPPPGQGPG